MPISKYSLRSYGLLAFIMLSLLLASSYAGPSSAQADTRLFPETGKTIRGKFLTYWNSNGGLPQQGFPISEEMQEVSDTDGKPYMVQYFERAVFEMHSENQPLSNVLLQLLGVFRYKQKYPNGAPQQIANTSIGFVSFSETGKHLGGLFLEYWKTNGALPQQGYPISEEFQERSDLDGKLYNVQYFERAVFEMHPENQPPYNVLLSQLGTFRYKAKYLQPTATPTSARPIATPSATPSNGADCSGIPSGQNLSVTPLCAPAGSVFFYTASGFQPGEEVSTYTTHPDGSVTKSGDFTNADGRGRVSDLQVGTYTKDRQGIWAATMEGKISGAKAIGYFKLLAPAVSDCSDIPESTNVQMIRNCIKAGESAVARAEGFYSYEEVFWYPVSPSGRRSAGETTHSDGSGKTRNISVLTDINTERGIWKVIFGGPYSGTDVGIGYFKVIAP